MHTLESWGWTPEVRALFEKHAPGLIPARIIQEQRLHYLAVTEAGEVKVLLPGRLRHRSANTAELPSVGDWAALTIRRGSAMVDRVMPRFTRISRRASGEKEEEQIVAANVDTVFIATSLNDDFTRRRLDRYLAMVRGGGSKPVILLTKLDVCKDPAPFVAEAEVAGGDAPVLVVSSKTPGGLDSLMEHLIATRTHALVGSSGVGKSTIVNALLGREAMYVREIREHDSRGKHATTFRHLFKLPGGALLIDTPGMREIQLWLDADQVVEAFEELAVFAEHCRFGNCRHNNEPGCAVREAAEAGKVSLDRYENYRKILGERTLPEWEQKKRDRISSRSPDTRTDEPK